MKRNVGVISIAFGAMLTCIPLQAMAECYMDTPSGYGSIGGGGRIGPYPDHSSCESVNSQYFKGGGTCSCTSSGASQRTTSPGLGLNPNMTPEEMMLNTVTNLMNNLGTGIQQGLEQNRQRAIQQQREQQRRQRALQEQARARERLYKEKEKRRRQEFKEARARMLGQMRGVQSSSLQFRKLEPLEVHETTGAFGIKTLKPRDLSSSTQLASAAPSSHGWLKKANCSAYLLHKALDNWNQEHFEEAAYLSNEAAALASGEKSSPSVVCPPLPDVPDVKGKQVPEDKARAEKFIKQTLLVSKLFARAASQMKDYKAIQQTAKQARQKVDEAKTRMEEAKLRKQAIEREQQQQTEAKKASMMAEALAALKKAKEALALSQKNLADAKKEQANMKKSMKKTREMFHAAQNHPDKTNEMIKQLDRTAKGEG